MKILSASLVVAVLHIGSQSFAATRYIGINNAADSGACTNQATPCATISYGISQMSAGDTLILGDGTYNESISLDSSGSAGKYLTIKAEHDGLAILTSSTASWDPVIRIQGSYWQVEGLKIVANAKSGVMRNTLGVYNGANYNKILRCAFVSTPCTAASTCADHGNVDLSGSYNLIEDSWAWGGGRYKFTIFGGDGASYGNHNILRRVVVRHDRQSVVNPQAGICLYQGGNNLVQNALVIDSDQLSHYTGNGNNNWQGAYFIEKGSQKNPNSIKGSMAINFGKGNDNHPAMAIFDDHQDVYNPGAIYVSNFFAYNGGAGFGQNGFTLNYAREIDHSAILNTDGSGADWGTPSMGPGFGMATSSLAKATNTIFNGIIGNPALYGAGGANNYNSFYGNTTNRTNSITGANDITNVNPLSASLLYPVRIETGSPLKGAGAGGTDIGPTILKRIGVSGTLYGETGYDTVTADNLWPWPNESRIKADMSRYPSNWPADGLPNPVRGFTAGNSLDGSSQTLTKYIWEILGNQIPSEIYGGGGDQISKDISGDGGGDTTNPTITISTSSSQSINSDSLTITGTASDYTAVSGVKWRIGAEPDAIHGTACTGTTTWSCSTSGYSSGSNTVYVGAYDAAGNYSSGHSITVNYTPPNNCTNYVRPDGSNSNAGTSNTAGGAWLTLQYAANTATAGAVVCVADGTYAGFYQETSGKSTNPITYRALGKGANITSRNSRTTDNINIESWTATPASYITIDGFNVYNATRMGIRAIDGTGIIVQNCTVHDNKDQGIFSGNTPRIQVLNNKVYANGSTNMQHNVYLSNAASDSPIVRGNHIYSSNAGNGLQLNGDYESGGDGYIDNALIENNIVYSNAQKGLSLISIRYGTVRNNIIYNNGDSAGGIHLVEEGGTYYSVGNTVVNNTIDEPGIAAIRVNSGNTGNVVFNNISIGPIGIVFEGTGNYQSNNYTVSSGGSSIFTSYSGHNYTLLSTSPAKEFGIASYQSKSAPATDYLGNVRPSSGGYDAGAYEYQTGGASGAIAPVGLTISGNTD